MVIAVVMEIDMTVLSYAIGGEVEEKKGDKENIIDGMLQKRERHSSKLYSLKSQADKSGKYWEKTECVMKTLWFSVENQDKYLIYLILDEFETLKWRCQLLRWI